MSKFIFTSESVTEGHPDKIADQISDAVVDAVFQNDTDPDNARVACETLLTTGLVVVAGEIRTNAFIDFQKLVRETITDIGYTRAKYGFDAETCGIIVSVHEQSADIAQGVDQAFENKTGEVDGDIYDKEGAGDQGMMFGYACRETKELMPLPIHLAHRFAHRLSAVRKGGSEMSYLRPDGKTQVTVEYENGLPKRIDTILISTQTGLNVDPVEQLLPDLKEHVIKPVLDDVIDGLSYDLEVDYKKIKYFANPTGKFEIGGPMGDTGLTGRKIIVDTYGGSARHGGGCFSGKDPTKVDRSAAYYARYIAKNIVAAGLAERCEIQLAYAIGVSKPVSILIETFGSENVDLNLIHELVHSHFDPRPGAIIRNLELRRPIFKHTAAYGHFGRHEGTFTWERTDKADILRKEAGL